MARLPTLDEWRKAAGKMHTPEGKYPAYFRDGRWVSKKSLMGQLNGKWSNFPRSRSSKALPVTNLEPGSPFGLLGIAGNVAEYVTDKTTIGSMGGSYMWKPDHARGGATLTRKPKGHRDAPLDCKEVGIRVVLDLKGR